MAYGANVFLPKVPRPALEFPWVGKKSVQDLQEGAAVGREALELV